MRRREFIAGIGSAAAWPLVARAQQATMPVIAYLSVTSPENAAPYLAALRQGLRAIGYVEGQNLLIEARFAHGHYDMFPTLVADLIERQVSVIVNATGGLVAAKSATSSIPIVSIFGDDPVKGGFVASLNRPGGNITGVYIYYYTLGAKRLELLRQLVPSAELIAILTNPTNPTPGTKIEVQEIESAAREGGQEIAIFNVSNETEFEPAFQAMIRRRIGALLVAGDPFFLFRRQQLVDLITRHKLPAIDVAREFTLAGGLMSYGPDILDAWRFMGNYTGRILNGAKPADLPIIQAVKVEFVINLKTAKALNIEVPPSLLARADEVIE